MIVAMIEISGLPIENFRNVRKSVSENVDHRRLNFSAGPLFQAPLDEMFELPHIEPGIETLLKSEAAIVARFGAAQLQVQQLVNRIAVPSDDIGRCQTLQQVRRHGVPEIVD